MAFGEFRVGEAEARAPYIRFERRSVENRAKTIKTGITVYDDIDYVVVTPHGSKDELESPYTDWIARLEDAVRAKRWPMEWLREVKEGYQLWKKGQEIPEKGTPLVQWSLLSPSQLKVLLAHGIRTVDEVAAMSDDQIARVGLGASMMRQRARDFLGNADAGKRALELEELRQQIQALKVRNESLEQRCFLLEGQKAAIAGEVESPAGEIDLDL